MDKNQPLWMPKGSVRAILALFVVGVTWGPVAFGEPVDDTLLGIGAAVLGGYGVYRVAEGKQDEGLK